ncbi:MAG: NAD(P)-dependent oxidoreductase, partial [Proteobacteria bacterium]|nr:NAD(P)-dependent oxidoreductase [Pseudomonadota bacterium]
TGTSSLLSADLTGKIVIDLTTNHYSDVPAFHDMCRSAGGDYLEAPVLGSVVPASQGKLTVLVSGRKIAYDRVQEILRNIGSNIFYLQEPALATKMKLINNLVLGTFMATLAEATALGENAGISKGDILEILSVGGGSSLVLNAKKTKLLEEDFSTHFSCALIAKDLHCLLDLANSLHKPLFTGAITKQLYSRTFEEDIAQEDFSAIYKIFKK